MEYLMVKVVVLDCLKRLEESEIILDNLLELDNYSSKNNKENLTKLKDNLLELKELTNEALNKLEESGYSDSEELVSINELCDAIGFNKFSKVKIMEKTITDIASDYVEFLELIS